MAAPPVPVSRPSAPLRARDDHYRRLGPTVDHPLQKAWIETQAPQCGYCQSGQIMQAAAMLKDFPTRPTKRSTP